jgi:micrococcal nuclease
MEDHVWRYRIGLAALVLVACACAGLVVVLARHHAGPTTPSAPGPVAPLQTGPAAGPPPSVPARAQRVVVTRHTDGDTLHLAATAPGVLPRGADTTVRLLEIDTPEGVDPGEPLQCYALRASRRLTALAPVGSRGWVLPDREVADPYGRALLYLWNHDGDFVNRTLVEEGMARAVLYPPNDRFIAQMRAAERRARAHSRGLWGGCAYFGQPVA